MLLSIIICNYNTTKKLRKTLDSLLAQNCDDCEVVVIDGASQDGFIDVINTYERLFHGRLRWVSEADNGIYHAMNKGITLAKGRYVNIIGAGDWLEEGVLRFVTDAMQKHPDYDAIYGKLRMWDKNIQSYKEVQTGADILPTTPMQHPALFYKKSLHRKFGMYDESYKIAADYLFCLKAFYFGQSSIFMIDRIVDNYVMDGISSTNIDLCHKENMRIYRSLHMIPHRFMRFFYKIFGITY